MASLASFSSYKSSARGTPVRMAASITTATVSNETLEIMKARKFICLLDNGYWRIYHPRTPAYRTLSARGDFRVPALQFSPQTFVYLGLKPDVAASLCQQYVVLHSRNGFRPDPGNVMHLRIETGFKWSRPDDDPRRVLERIGYDKPSINKLIEAGAWPRSKNSDIAKKLRNVMLQQLRLDMFQITYFNESIRALPPDDAAKNLAELRSLSLDVAGL